MRTKRQTGVHYPLKGITCTILVQLSHSKQLINSVKAASILLIVFKIQKRTVSSVTIFILESYGRNTCCELNWCKHRSDDNVCNRDGRGMYSERLVPSHSIFSAFRSWL